MRYSNQHYNTCIILITIETKKCVTNKLKKAYRQSTLAEMKDKKTNFSNIAQ